MTPRLERAGLVTAVAAGLVLCVLSAVLTVTESPSSLPALEALARAAMVGVPIAVGVYALGKPAFQRFGALLIAAGACWFVANLSVSSDPLLYSIGRVTAWLGEVGLLYLVLSFPTGRLLGHVDRLLVGIAVVVVLTLYLPTALLVEEYPAPSLWSVCTDDCPRNAFMVSDSEPAFVGDVLVPVRELLTVALFAAATVWLALRIRRARHLLRRTLLPVLVVAGLRTGVMAIAVATRHFAPDSGVVHVLLWMLALAVPAMAIAFLVGLARWRLFVVGAMQRLAADMPTHPSPDDLRRALADAFDDPGLEIVYWLEGGGGHWADANGQPVAEPAPGSGRCLTVVCDGDQRVAGIIFDEALRDEQGFVDAATSYAVMTLENHRLTAQASLLLRQVAESRARIQATADDERRRIERDLHDGAQQRLVALRIKLELAAEQMDDPTLLRGLGDDVEEALDEIRDLARGIYPAPLADRGLVEGLRAAALRSALPTTVLAAGVRRYPREIESAAYFCCLEALQNAAKHAGATAAVIDLSDNGSLHAEVRDDGAGYAPERVAEGVGLTSMRDRIAAVGGAVAIRSSPGHGTRVTVEIPLP